ncbi:MAG: hypothetical protein U0168_25060 [Nannocystaceae bacterium]
MFAFVEFGADEGDALEDDDDDVITGIPTHPGLRGADRWEDDDDDVPPEAEDEGVPLSSGQHPRGRRAGAVGVDRDRIRDQRLRRGPDPGRAA